MGRLYHTPVSKTQASVKKRSWRFSEPGLGGDFKGRVFSRQKSAGAHMNLYGLGQQAHAQAIKISTCMYGHEVFPLHEILVAFDCCWEKETQSSSMV